MANQGTTVHHGEEINNSTGVSNKKLQQTIITLFLSKFVEKKGYIVIIGKI